MLCFSSLSLQQRIKLCAQLVTNEGFGAATMLLESQALRLERQARLRDEAKVAAADTARRAQLAQAEARQAATAAGVAVAAEAGAGVGGGPGDEFSHSAASAASAAAAKAIEAARLATESSEVAAAAAAATVAKGEQWLGADSLAVLLGGLVDCTPEVQAHVTAVEVIKRTCQAVMLQVSVLSEEELKRENQEVRACVRLRKSHYERVRRFCFSCFLVFLCSCVFLFFLEQAPSLRGSQVGVVVLPHCQGHFFSRTIKARREPPRLCRWGDEKSAKGVASPPRASTHRPLSLPNTSG